MERKRSSPANPHGSAHLVFWVTQSPGAGESPRLERVVILSGWNPTRMLKRPGSGEPDQHLIHVMSAMGRDFPTARAKLIRRIRRTPTLIWMVPWLEHWDSRDRRSPPSQSPPMSLTKAMAQAD
ncbi:hypothetical protein HY634_01065 [Candidatus Uhrbacteria bacterium]|nr:hypothetical protein [Candidatus Uhrbacteria bacterium]